MSPWFWVFWRVSWEPKIQFFGPIYTKMCFPWCTDAADTSPGSWVKSLGGWSYALTWVTRSIFQDLLLFSLFQSENPNGVRNTQNLLGLSKAPENRVSKPRPPRYYYREWTKVFRGATEVKNPRFRFSSLILAVLAQNGGIPPDFKGSDLSFCQSESDRKGLYLKLWSRPTRWATLPFMNKSSSGSQTDITQKNSHFWSFGNETVIMTPDFCNSQIYDSASHCGHNDPLTVKIGENFFFFGLSDFFIKSQWFWCANWQEI